MSDIPLTGQLLSVTGMIPVRTAGRPHPSTIKRALEKLQAGELLGVFPEGEDYIFANDFQAPLAPFTSGFARLAYLARVPVIPSVIVPFSERLAPIAIPPAARTRLERHHDLSRVTSIVRYRHVEVRVGRPISLTSVAHVPKREQVAWLVQAARRAMSRLQHGADPAEVPPG